MQENYKYIAKGRKMDSFRQQLIQLINLTWDGDLISKDDRTELVKLGFVERFNNGWNLITKRGIEHLEQLNILKP